MPTAAMNARAAAKEKLIFALDVASADDARGFVIALRDRVGLFKVGLELFVAEGPRILELITGESAAGIFLDLKFHDIPETMRAARRAADRHRVRFLTVHCEQRDRLADRKDTDLPRLLGVTVLTSIGAEEVSAAGWYPPDLTVETLAMLRAETAFRVGCAGVVCSGNEVSEIKRCFGSGFLAVTPGIRPAWAAVPGDDQRRAATPALAIAQGADYLVVGRPIRTAPDPAEAADRVIEEIAGALRR